MYCSKNHLKKTLLSFGICYLFYVSGLIIFMNGIISSTTCKLHPIPPHNLLKICSEGVGEEICMFHRNMFQKFYSSHSQKVIVMLIDGLRSDFIPSVKYNVKFNVSMPYTESLLKNGSATSFVTQGFAPTVTLPRIKTLVTGTVANFIDILLNFNAAELDEDNILKQASLSGMKSVFYGDDTWLKLFPNLFIRSEGTHSFFVSDFTEVDFNVSRHIKYEIDSKDWDILILHFLGVDHIGHAYGPFSEHLSPKLLEMDKIIKYMYEKMKNDPPSLIIVCGDHGMTTSGSHGGITQDELLTPLIFISTASHQSDLKNNAIIDQVDFAPTLSAVLGLPIPANSIGKIIPDVLKFVGFSNEEILYATYFNLLQISKIYVHIFPLKKKQLHFAKETIESHYKSLKNNNTLNNFDYIHLIKSYEVLIRNMKNDLLDNVTGYNDFLLIMGLEIMWLSILFSFYTLLPSDYNRIFLSISNKKILSIITMISLVVITTYRYLNTSIIIIYFSMLLLIFMYQIFLLLKYFNEKMYITFTGKICLFFLFAHALSLFSSSYIEEEHRTWYYFTCSVITLICFQKLYFSLKIQLMTVCNLKMFWSKCSSLIFFTLLALISHRTFSKWNQVGNKWQHLPDISDWLNQKENIMYLGILVLISQFILMFYFKQKLESLNYTLFTTSLLLIALKKLNNLDLLSYLKIYITQMLIPQVIYLLSIFIIVSSFLQIYFRADMSKSKKVQKFIINFISGWILLIEIIGRAHNIPVIIITLIQEDSLSRLTWKNDFSIVTNTITYFIMAMTSFSYYGNSNSLSTIDVYTGYTGIQSYKPLVVGFLLVCNTYSTLVLWLIMLFYRIVHLNCDFENLVIRVKLTVLYLLEYKLIVLSLYCIVMFLMRHHLFIYSVFFPKIFYELCHVILISFIYLFVTFIIDRA